MGGRDGFAAMRPLKENNKYLENIVKNSVGLVKQPLWILFKNP